VPNVFVALKSARQAAAKMPAQASTAPVRSNNPTWNHLLAVEMHSDELPDERLLLAMVNADTNKLLAKASLPMKALRPGRHYNLRLLLESPVAGADTPSLDVTLHVHGTPRAALQWAAQHPDAVHVEAGVVAVQGAAEDAEAQSDSTQGMAPVMAKWSLVEDVDAAGLSLLPSTAPVFAPADASDEAALQAVLTELNTDTSFDAYPVLTSLAGACPSLSNRVGGLRVRLRLTLVKLFSEFGQALLCSQRGTRARCSSHKRWWTRTPTRG